MAAEAVHHNEASGGSESQINILLFGESGVGKSTLINAFANYMSFESLDEAAAKDASPICLIPMNFDIIDDEGIERPVNVGEDDNENFQDGESATQQCRSFEFLFKNLKIVIIDTPGIGASAGEDQDKKNMDHIMRYIAQFKAIHAFIYLVKSNCSRLNPSFKYHIQQLLEQLSKNAATNIIFVYTQCRATRFGPGSTTKTLRVFLEDVKSTPPHVEILNNKDNTFYFENDSLHFLFAVRKGIPFFDYDKEDYVRSWKKAVEESHRMMTYILKLSPHQMQNTVSVNEARRIVSILQKPMGDLADIISYQITTLDKHVKSIENLGDIPDIEELKKLMYVPELDVETKTFKPGNVVCLTMKCREEYKIGDSVKFHNPVVCIANISQVKFYGYWLSRLFVARKCSKCECSFSAHRHVYYKTILKEKKVLNKAAQEQIENKERQKAVEILIADINKKIQKLKSSAEQVIKIAARCSYFLHKNAIIPSDDSFEKYLDELFNESKKLINRGTQNENISQQMGKFCELFKKQRKNLADEGKEISLYMIYDEITKLRQLELPQINFSELIDAYEQSIEWEQQEHKVTVPIRPSRAIGERIRQWMLK